MNPKILNIFPVVLVVGHFLHEEQQLETHDEPASTVNVGDNGIIEAEGNKIIQLTAMVHSRTTFTVVA
jgi:hypothetical protein